MNEMEKQTSFEQYNVKTHRMGRIFLTIGLVALLVAPFIMGLVVNAMPDIPPLPRPWPRSPSSISPAVWWNF